MKILSSLFCFLLGLIAMPALLDRSSEPTVGGLQQSAISTSEHHKIQDAPAIKPDRQSDTDAAPPVPARSQRSRRPARIDLTMPYYRFGRAPIRIKD